MPANQKLRSFGEPVEGYPVPVLNEREIRAAAGILFAALFLAILLVLLKEDFRLIKYVVFIFFSDLLIRVLFSPRFAPFLILGRWIVRGQAPEYVGAPQKNFAWKIGIGISGLMFLLLIVLNSYSLFSGLACFLCLIFLFFESAFGICLGCLFYPLFYKNAAACPGEACARPTRQPIQRISRAQVLALIAFELYLLSAILLFQDRFRQKPHSLWQNGTTKTV